MLASLDVSWLMVWELAKISADREVYSSAASSKAWDLIINSLSSIPHLYSRMAYFLLANEVFSFNYFSVCSFNVIISCFRSSFPVRELWLFRNFFLCFPALFIIMKFYFLNSLNIAPFHFVTLLIAQAVINSLFFII